jgi:peptidoglycan hydrolase-like protein with peptidoglycan-binding domain
VSSSFKTLRFGSQGPAVADLQRKLNTVAPQLSPPLAEDGVFGQKTFTRVKEVQKLGSLVPDGAVGPQTWLLLANVIAGVVTLLGEVSPQNPFPDEHPFRRAIATTAWQEWMNHGALVHARYPGPVDPKNGRKFRQGYTHLLKYFRTAAPSLTQPGTTHYGDENVTYLPVGFGQKDSSDSIPMWCGIFALWAVKAAGLHVGNWVDGDGIGRVSFFTRADFPRKGDIAYKDAERHHAVVFQVRTDEAGRTLVTTIDGNSGAGGSITRNESPISRWQSFSRVTYLPG